MTDDRAARNPEAFSWFRDCPKSAMASGPQAGCRPTVADTEFCDNRMLFSRGDIGFHSPGLSTARTFPLTLT